MHEQNEKLLKALLLAQKYLRVFLDQGECDADCKQGCTCGRFNAVVELRGVDLQIAKLVHEVKN